MCQKQCRDENGFKCHCLSESHARQMSLFRDNPKKFMENYSVDFEKAYMEILKRRGRTRVKANSLYQDLVADRQHTHMNSTKWETLSTFVQYLGKTGKAEVDLVAGKGWYIKYIDRDPVVVARQEALAKREANELDEEEKNRRRMAQQIEDAKKHEEETGQGPEVVEATDLVREDDNKIAFAMKAPTSISKKSKLTLEDLTSIVREGDEDDNSHDRSTSPIAIEDDEENEHRKKKKKRKKTRSRSSSPSQNDKKHKSSKSNDRSSSRSSSSRKDSKSRKPEEESSRSEKEEKGRGSSKKKGKTNTLAALMKENEEMKAKQKKGKTIGFVRV